MKRTIPYLLSALSLCSLLLCVKPAEARGTNCWGGFWKNTRVANIYYGKALVVDRCPKAIFRLINSEADRNIRKLPTTNSPIVGKLTNGKADNYFLSSMIVTIDNGVTYWAYGTVVSANESIYRENIDSQATVPGLKGWIEVGNTEVIQQYDRPESNDVWFKLR